MINSLEEARVALWEAICKLEKCLDANIQSDYNEYKEWLRIKIVKLKKHHMSISNMIEQM